MNRSREIYSGMAVASYLGGFYHYTAANLEATVFYTGLGIGATVAWSAFVESKTTPGEEQ